MTDVFDGLSDDLREQFSPQTLTGIRFASVSHGGNQIFLPFKQ